MQNIQVYIRSFFQSNGVWVGLAMFISKVSFFIINLYIAQKLLKEEVGLLFKAQNFICFFIPFVGLGAYQGLLKFGSSLSSKEDFSQLEGYTFYKGFFGQLLLNFVMMALGVLLFGDEVGVLSVILWFSIRLMGLFLVEGSKASARASFQNKKFALIEITVSLVSLVLVLLLIPIYGLWGFVMAFCLSPFVVVFFGFHRLRISKTLSVMKPRDFWQFSHYTSFVSFVNEVFFLTDILLIGFLFSDEVVAEYKVASFIPLNLLFLSRVFIHTDYPMLCKSNQDKTYLKQYIQRYLSLFVPLAFLVVGVCYAFSSEVLLWFGRQYVGQADLFALFLVSAFFAMVFRTPFSNLLFAINKSKEHLYISIFSVLLLCGLGFVFSKSFNVEGVAYAHILATIISSLLYILVFVKYLRTNKSHLV